MGSTPKSSLLRDVMSASGAGVRSEALPTASPAFAAQENGTGECGAVTADFQYVLLPVAYSLVFVLGMAGNAMALLHFIRTRSTMQPSNIFLVNLCAIDLLFVLTLPFNIAYHARGNDWPFGEALCKVNGSLFFGNLYGSSLFLMLISVDRYIAVVHPLQSLKLRNPKHRILLSCAVWVVLAAVILYLTLKGPLTRPFQSTGKIACMENFSSEAWRGRISTVSILAAVIGFFLPLLVIATCYPLIACKLLAPRLVEGAAPSTSASGSGRIRKKALRMVLLVLVVFLLCFAPYHLNQLVHTLRRMGVLSGCPLIHFTYRARRVAMALCSLNSCLDPLVYCLASESFRWNWRGCARCFKLGQKPPQRQKNAAI
ncbi:lysophosphatidic acid receptor 6 [Lepisosteus oculatus]|nr:PREDICTED: lysophosphatidic acid receptor 6-like [Lepisosteus oculatus]